MSYDPDRDRRGQPIAGPPEGGGYGEYEHPYPRGGAGQGLRPDSWDQMPPSPYRPQGRPAAQSQADGFAGRGDERDDRRDSFARRSAGRGPHAGRGPKGYQRSDERIREIVSEALTRDGDLDASEMEVSVERGEVTLQGTAPNRWSKRLAEDLVQDLPGVKEVHNRLRVEDRGDGH
jgi:hypothetical protein